VKEKHLSNFIILSLEVFYVDFRLKMAVWLKHLAIVVGPGGRAV
jgi:hypothetical protein